MTLKILKVVMQIAWTVCVVGLFTFLGAFNGYESTGTVGAVVVGGIGFFFGAALSAVPAVALELFGR
jgi:hypothetical protein